jgi:hypothetical protein
MRSWSRVAPWSATDEHEDCFGWVADERIARTSHALRVDGGVYLIDPLLGEGVEERIRALGEPAAVMQLLDRHNRDCAAWAERLGVPHVRAWRGLGGAPFEALAVYANRVWREVALWEPVSATLVCADALGTLPYFRARGERIGWHPLVRLSPPRSFETVAPSRILVGHGAGLEAGATAALADLAANGRRRLPAAWAEAIRTSVRGAST